MKPAIKAFKCERDKLIADAKLKVVPITSVILLHGFEKDASSCLKNNGDGK